MDRKRMSSNQPLVRGTVSFDPNDPKSVDALLSKLGPEGLYEIANVLRKAAEEDVDSACQDAFLSPTA